MAESISSRSVGSSRVKRVRSRTPRPWRSRESKGVTLRPPARGRPGVRGEACGVGARCCPGLEGRQRGVARVGDVEERVELGELEEGAQVLVEVGQPQL